MCGHILRTGKTRYNIVESISTDNMVFNDNSQNIPIVHLQHFLQCKLLSKYLYRLVHTPGQYTLLVSTHSWLAHTPGYCSQPCFIRQCQVMLCIYPHTGVHVHAFRCVYTNIIHVSFHQYQVVLCNHVHTRLSVHWMFICVICTGVSACAVHMDYYD